jgi:hypothetical protein
MLSGFPGSGTDELTQLIIADFSTSPNYGSIHFKAAFQELLAFKSDSH